METVVSLEGYRQRAAELAGQLVLFNEALDPAQLLLFPAKENQNASA